MNALPETPASCAHIQQFDVDGDLILFDGTSGATHQLNQSASAVWRACDGKRTIAEVVSSVSAIFGLAPSSIERDVVSILAGLLSLGLVSSSDASDRNEPSANIDGQTVMVVPAPTPCLTRLDELDWVKTFAVQVESTIVGVRTNSDASSEALAEACGALLVDEPQVVPFYSLRVEPTTTRGVQHLHTLYEGDRLIRATREPACLLPALADRLALFRPDPPSVMRLQGGAIVGPRGAATVPLELMSAAEALQPRLARQGVSVLAPPVRIDVVGGVLLVGTGPAPLSEQPWRRFTDGGHCDQQPSTPTLLEVNAIQRANGTQDLSETASCLLALLAESSTTGIHKGKIPAADCVYRSLKSRVLPIRLITTGDPKSQVVEITERLA